MERTLYAATYAGAILASVALTPLVVGWARRWGVVDLPGSRKVHQEPMPRLGGLAIAGSMISVALAALLLAHVNLEPRILVVVAASLFVLCLGVLDDLFDLPSKFKLLALVAAAVAVCGIGVRIDAIILHGYSDIRLGWAAWPLTVLWIVGITVSINFIDGLDGLAAGIAAIACAMIAVTASCSGQFPLAIIALALLGSLTGFLFFNFNPAKIFMGDCGSMFIGFMLGCLSVMQHPTVGTTVGLLLPSLALAVPLMDTLLTVIRRVVLHRGSVFSAERGHIHHRLLDLGLGQRHAVLILYSASLVSAGVGLLAMLEHGWPELAGLGLLIPLLLGLFRTAGSTQVRETVIAIRRNRAIGNESKRYHRAFQELQLNFRNVTDFDGWWKQICATAEALDFVSLEIPIVRRDGSRHVLQWARKDGAYSGDDMVEATLPIRQRRRGPDLRARFEVASLTFLETAGQRIALFARLMGDYSVSTLPESAKRVRARGPSGESTATPSPNVNGNGNGNGKGHGNGHADETAITFSHDTENRKSIGATPIIRLMAPRQELRDLPEVGIAASIEDTDLPALPNVFPRSLDGLKIAVVHDFLYCYAGAERVLEQILRVFPQADLFALFDFLPAKQRGFIQDKQVQTTFIQKLPLARRIHRAYLPLMPLAIEQIDVSQYDIVISSSYLAAKGVLTRADQLHVSYCHTPARFAWDLQHQYLGARGIARGIKTMLPRMIFHYIRNWDVRTANGVDVYITNSDYVGRRIEKVYRRRATTIYPPVDTERFTPGSATEDFYLTASRLVPYKRVDVIVEAFNRMPNRRLIVVGDGPEYEKIRAKAGPNIKLVGHQPQEKLKQYMQLARAFVFAAEEDFGIVPVEAQACGTPVIAFGRGGVTESVLSGRSGVFYKDQTPESLMAAVQEFDSEPLWDRQKIREHAARFSASRFRTEFRNLVEAEWNTFEGRRGEASKNLASAIVRRSPFDVSAELSRVIEAARALDQRASNSGSDIDGDGIRDGRKL